ncbi:MAG: transglycosylase SLT domain-containing protein [Burkholderiales bacterium]|nr:transglycosylase SLT domain-containing protein [Burkholderiales bacterium]
MANANENTYGAIADKYAAQYGIDPTTFRNLIRSESSFDPYAINPRAVNGENAAGIAQFLPSTAQEKGVNVFDANSSLEGAAKYLSELTVKYGSTAAAIAKYKGYTDINKGIAETKNIVGNAPVVDNASPKSMIDMLKSPVDTAKGVGGKIADFFMSGFYPILIGFIGLLIIVLTIWSVFKSK